MPAASCPSTIGSGSGQSPFMMCQSLWQTPAALTFTRASPACGPCCSTSTTSSPMFGLYRTAAFISRSFAVGSSRAHRPAMLAWLWRAALRHHAGSQQALDLGFGEACLAQDLGRVLADGGCERRLRLRLS